MTMSEGFFQPGQFLRYVPVMAMEQRDELLLTVPYLCQYNNCSVVVVLAEHPSGGLLSAGLTIETHSDSLIIRNPQGRTVGGGGTDIDHRYRFAVTPRIPDAQVPSLPMTFHVVPGPPAIPERPVLEGTFQPEGFQRYVPVRAAEQRDDQFATVPYVCQYANCTVVLVRLEHPSRSLLYSECNLTIPGHAVRVLGGVLGGTHEHGFRFAVVPPIPDEQVSNLPMTFHIDPGTAQTFPGHKPAPIVLIAPTTIRFPSRSISG